MSSECRGPSTVRYAHPHSSKTRLCLPQRHWHQVCTQDTQLRLTAWNQSSSEFSSQLLPSFVCAPTPCVCTQPAIDGQPR